MSNDRLGELVRREYRKMVNYIRARVSSVAEMDAEDFVQEVLVSVLESADPTLPLENLAAYVYRALRNRVIDFFRVRKPKLSLDAPMGEEDNGLLGILKDMRPDALARMSHHETETELYAVLQKLKPIEREVIMAHALEGVSFKELAETWEMPLNTLLSHKSRGMAKVKQYWNAYVKEV
jgi:RNA polymerase sigma factor (sigma-70 family)